MYNVHIAIERLHLACKGINDDEGLLFGKVKGQQCLQCLMLRVAKGTLR